MQAQDRFFEMDFRRHVTAGRLCEMFGKSTVETDKYIRTMGWRRVAEQEYDLLGPADAELPRGLQRRRERLPQGPHADRPVGGVHRARAHRARLQAGEVDAGRLAGLAQGDGVGPARQHGRRDRRAALLSAAARPSRSPSSTRATPTTGNKPIVDRPPQTAPSGCTLPRPAPGTGAVQALDAVRRGVDAIPDLMGRGSGHRLQLLGGLRRAHRTGKPLLANDPHLDASMPGIWYQMGLHCRSVDADCPFDVSGFTFSGRARRGHRPQPRHRLGVHQPGPRRHRPLPGEGRPARPISTTASRCRWPSATR